MTRKEIREAPSHTLHSRIKWPHACQVQELVFLPLLMAFTKEDIRTLYWIICLHGFDFTLIKTCVANAVGPRGHKALRSLSEPWFPDLRK